MMVQPSRQARRAAAARSRSQLSGKPRSGVADVREVAEALPIPVWMTDTRGRCSFVNRAWQALTGISTREARGEGWLRFVHPKDRPRVRRTLDAAREARQPLRLECRCLRADESIRTVELAGAPLSAGGRFRGYVGAALDTTSARRTPELLRSSEERYRKLADGIGEIFFTTDEAMRCTYWNKASARLTHIPLNEAIGRPIDGLFPSSGDAIQDLLEEARASAAMRTRELRLSTNGQAGSWQATAFPVAEGFAVLMHGSAPEAPGAEPYRTIFEKANDAMMIFEPDSEIVLEANQKACELYGTSRESLLGTSLKARTLDVARGQEQIRRTLREGTCTDFDTIHLREDGTPISLRVNSSAISYRGQRAILSIGRDTTPQKEVEEYLNRALAWQEALFEGSSEAAFVLEETGRIMAVNRAAQSLTGYGAAELTQMLITHLVADTEREAIRLRCEEAREGDGLRWEGLLRDRSGAACPVEFRAGAVEVAGTRYLRLSARDVRAQRETEQRLRLSEQRYRLFVEQNTDGVWRLEAREPIPVDLPEEEQIERMYRDAVVVEANDAFARMHGFSSGTELIGKGLEEFVPRSRPEYLEYVRTFIRTGYRLLDAESRTVDSQGRVTFYHTTFFGTVENGYLVSAWGSQRDITERLQNERKIRLLAQTIASAKDCVYLTDLSGTVLYVNDAFLATYGYAEEELLGHSITTVHAANEKDRAEASARHGAGASGWYGELMSRRKSGELFPVELWTSLVRNDEGEPVAVVGVARDITERRRAEEQIRRSLREKEVLLKEIHHRVKNNLQVISSLLNLQSEYIHDPEMLKVFKESQFRVRSMALVHEKLYRSASLAEINLAEYIRELATQLFRSFGLGKQGVQLEVEVEEGMLGIDLAIPCGIILNELITNALKYGFPDDRSGVVYVEMNREPSGNAVMVVGDTGVGMPQGLDVHATDSLGLKLVTMLCEQLQGTLTLINGGRRRGSPTGTEFVIRFPAVEGAGSSPDVE
jgi:PAS domain S-box-containing protein